MEPGLPPELDALKNNIRQIVKDECIPLESEFLSNPPKDGEENEGAPRGILEAVPGILGTLPKDKWDHLTQISKDTGIYTSFVPEEYGGGGMGALATRFWRKRYTRAFCTYPRPRYPCLCLGIAHRNRKRSTSTRRSTATSTTLLGKLNPKLAPTPAE